MKRSAIKLKDVTKTLTDEVVPVTLLKNISFEVNTGEFVSITGPSGSGKSSLMYLIGLLDNPTNGEVYIDSVNTISSSAKEKEKIRLEKIGFVFQFHFLLPEFTALENIMLPMQKLGKLKQAEITARAKDLMGYFGLEKCINKKPGQLSGGERQRVAIARAMANDPMIILADEPTGNLDTKNAKNVFDMFEKLVSKSNKTVITITHDPDLAALTHRQIHIVDGMIR